MRTLDNQIYFEVNIPAGTTLGVYPYALYMTRDSEHTENLVFTGNFYYDGIETKHRFDLTDVIRSLKKTIDISSTAGYPASAELVLLFTIKLFIGSSTIWDNTWYPIAMIYEYPHKLSYMNNENVFSSSSHIAALQGLETSSSQFKLVPRYPLIETNKYCYVQAFLTVAQTSSFDLRATGNETGSGTFSQIIRVFGDTNDILSRYISNTLEDLFQWENIGTNEQVIITDTNSYGGSKVIAEFDKCYSHYYLMWQDRFGGIQSQPFNDKMTYSETFSVTETQNYANQRRKSFIQVQPKWKLNSDWISEDVYPIYESIFVSPILKLYDAYEDKIYDVIVSGDYTEKTYRNEKKLLNLTLNLESITKQNIIY